MSYAGLRESPEAASCGQGRLLCRHHWAGGLLPRSFPTTPRGCWQEPRFLATWATLSAWCCHLGLPPQAVMREEARRQLYLVLEVTHLRRQDGRSPESPGRL